MSSTQPLTEWFRHVPEDKWLRDPSANREDAQRIYSTLGLKPGQLVFECPCGKADLSFPLARLGCRVAGIDFNAHFVSAAKNKFRLAGLEGSFQADDMRQANFPKDCDLIVNWASSFGYFSDEDNAQLARRYADALKSGGRLLIEVANPARVIAGTGTRLIASGEVVTETYSAQTKRASVIFPATEFRGPVTAKMRIYTTDEYQSLLTQCGLTNITFYGTGFTPFDATQSTRLIVLAHKP